MEWISSLFKSKATSSTLTNFKAAGCVFTDGRYILAGYQPKRSEYNISGFGGSRLDNETYMQTAIRETLEEFFEVDPPRYLIDDIEQMLTPTATHINESYVLVQYTFEDLIKLLGYSKSACKHTDLYDVFPESLNDLIFNRNHTPRSEVHQLCLLPFKSNIKIGRDFKMDITLINKISTV
jgi:hypothetical protein